MKRRTYGFGSLRQRNDIWYIRYRINGVMREESTRITDKAEAEKLLQSRIIQNEFLQHELTLAKLAEVSRCPVCGTLCPQCARAVRWGGKHEAP